MLENVDNDTEVSFQDGQEVQLDDGTTAFIYHRIQGILLFTILGMGSY